MSLLSSWTSGELGLFLLMALSLTLLPGADSLLVIRKSLSQNTPAALWTDLGICLGLYFHATLSGLGLSLILLHSAWAFWVLKLAGAMYLCYLGWQSLVGAHRRREAEAMSGQSLTLSWRANLVEGLLSNLLNPKVAVFYLAFLPQFLGQGEQVWAKALFLAGLHFFMSLVWLAFLAWLVGKGRQWAKHQVWQARVESWCGGLLLLLGIKLLLSD